MSAPHTPAGRSAAHKRARRYWALAATSVLMGPALIAAAACGANGVDAPERRVSKEAELQQCRTFDELMPRFHAALNTGQTEGLRVVIQNHLLQPERPGEPPPINDVLRSIFMNLARFAAQPPELGASANEVCAQTPPPVELAHPLCEMRRAMDTLVHEGKGLDALKLVDPLLAAVFDYVRGRPPAAAQPHYEVATAIHSLCQQNAHCGTSDTLDLVIAFTTYMESTEGRASIDRTVALVNNPALQPFLQDDGAQYGGENGIVALVDVLITTVLGMDDPADLDALPIDQMPADLQPDMRAGLADLKSMLDPARQPNILVPLKKVLNCYRNGDANRDIVRMVYRLGLESNVPEFGLTTIVGAVQGLRDTDQRGTLIHLVLTLSKALRTDEQAMDSLARVCRAMFSTEVAPGETRSPAELALPVIADLFNQGVAAEALCAADTLIYGCAGGVQPACQTVP